MTAMYQVPVRVSSRDDMPWQQWVARGEAQDRELRQRVQRAALLIASTIALWLSATWALR